jgi:hypothetical protein
MSFYYIVCAVLSGWREHGLRNLAPIGPGSWYYILYGILHDYYNTYANSLVLLMVSTTFHSALVQVSCVSKSTFSAF